MITARSLETAGCGAHRLHLHILAGSGGWASGLGPTVAQPLVTLLEAALELIIGGRTGPAKHKNPVLQPTALGEGSVPIFLKEFVRVEELSSRLAPGHQEYVIAQQSDRIQKSDDAIDGHSERHTEVLYSYPIGQILLVRIHVDLC